MELTKCQLLKTSQEGEMVEKAVLPRRRTRRKKRGTKVVARDIHEKWSRPQTSSGINPAASATQQTPPVEGDN